MTVMHQECLKAPGFELKPSGKLNGWLKLIAIVLGLVSFFVVLGPVGLKLPWFKPIAQYIEANDINANAYYYTEVGRVRGRGLPHEEFRGAATQ